MSQSLPEALHHWVESTCGYPIAAAHRPSSGASREAWAIDLDARAEHTALFLLQDKGNGRGSEHEAQILKALAQSPIPAPTLVAHSPEHRAILLHRVAGSSDYNGLDDDNARTSIAADLMQVTAAMHQLDISRDEFAFLEAPTDANASLQTHLAALDGLVEALGDNVEPFFLFAASWLRRHAPNSHSPLALVHSDLGPDNFMFDHGKISAILDWEIAHLGDPMEDLATIAVRDMATPIGDLEQRYQEYERASGRDIDRELVAFYRVLILTRNSLMITLGLTYPTPEFDALDMLRYQALLMRGAAICIADFHGIPRTQQLAAPSTVSTVEDPMLGALRSALTQQQQQLATDNAVQRARFDRMLGALHALTTDPAAMANTIAGEIADCNAVLATSAQTLDEATAALRHAATSAALSDDGAYRNAVASHFVQRLLRLSLQRAPLMGELYERLPQPIPH